MSKTAPDTFEGLGFSEDEASLLETCGLLPADLDGWQRDDAMTLARAVNHQGVDALTVEYLFTTHRGDLSAAFEDMAEDGGE
jgi:hypothetical protein